MQFDGADYMTEEEIDNRCRLSQREFVAHLKATSDADRGKSNYHGVSRRENGKWQARISGVAVRPCLLVNLWITLCTTSCECHVPESLSVSSSSLWR